ncbi:hypothetical protein X770_21430 [Mesorhizobium sp. LSJC269B00]|uniref:hypothetical protein n=1 Tax=Mesorhizobium sp. LSJC269B00 TaxID=1287326 RepID=UPI0003CEDD1D|nr:hypothetical protein [Mesorhizobium sp. LSJC269B00]ESW85964.1 hypothetical protein X770_21430 [Mesorhizobium sp. LSJC269B00]
MIRLLITGLFAYVTYRIAKEIIKDVPDNFDPLPVPGDERATLRRQSAATGVAPRR